MTRELTYLSLPLLTLLVGLGRLGNSSRHEGLRGLDSGRLLVPNGAISDDFV